MMNSAVMLLEQAADRYPDRIALEDGTQLRTYSQLRREARTIGAALLRRSAGTAPVMVYLPKSVSMVEGFFGALYSGRPYVPTDAAAPAARIQRIISNLHPSAIITNGSLMEKLQGLELGGAACLELEQLLAEEPGEDAVNRALSSVIDADPVYIMYTSGSTGEPKGVTIPHRGVIHFAQWAKDTFGWDSQTVIANQAPLYFDVSVMDVYGALACGGRLILTPEALFRFPSKLPEFLRDNHVTSIYWVPTVMIHIANAGALEGVALPELRSVAFAGEVMPNRQLNIWRRALPGRIYANLYGPTETDVCTCYVVDRPFQDQDPLPIGRALPNMRVALVDADGQVSQEGEICVAASGITLGYWNQPELTQKSFVELTVNGGCPPRYNRTGDLGRWNDRGELMFLGRKDGQIKLRGNRIELAEVENAARQVEGVENACALLDRENQRIVLFAQTDREITARQFGRSMRRFLPAYMIPEKYVTMEALPLTPNKKIDRVLLKTRLEAHEYE